MRSNDASTEEYLGFLNHVISEEDCLLNFIIPRARSNQPNYMLAMMISKNLIFTRIMI